MGMPPTQMINASPKAKRFFTTNEIGQYVCRRKDAKVNYRPPGSRTLDEILGTNTGGPFGRRKNEPGHSPDEYNKFKDLIQRMLDYNPVKRLCAAEAMRHPFLRKHSTGPEDAMGNSIQNTRYNVNSGPASDQQNSSRLSFAAENASEELTNIQRRIEIDDYLPADEIGNPNSNTLMQPIGYYT